MTAPSTALTSKQAFQDYCLKRLGYPVIEINVSQEQIDDRIADALQKYQDYHFDGSQKIFFIKAVTQQDINQRYFDLSNATTGANNDPIFIIGVTRIFPLTDSQATINMFDLRYQLRLNELYDFTSASYVNFTMTQQHLRSLELMFSGEVPIRFQRYTQRLYVDWNWGTGQVPVGQIAIAECYATVDPNFYPLVWEDQWLKRYATALIKRQWGNNLKKYKNILIPGGIALNGGEIYDEAEEEIKQLEEELIGSYSGVPEFYLN